MRVLGPVGLACFEPASEHRDIDIARKANIIGHTFPNPDRQAKIGPKAKGAARQRMPDFMGSVVSERPRRFHRVPERTKDKPRFDVA